MRLNGPVLTMLCVAAACGQAHAEEGMQFSGTLQGAYSDYDATYSHLGVFNTSGSALFTASNPGFDLQGNFSDSQVSASAHGGNGWTVGGDAFWRDYAGTIGANFTSHAIPGLSSDYLSYDAFGQWFVLPEATLQIKGGWMSSHYDGPFGSAGVVVYPINQIALDLTADYAKANHLGPEMKDIGLSAEFLPIVEIPVSLAISYTRARIDRLPFDPRFNTDRNSDIFGVALKIYFGGGGESNTLRDYQRNGPVYWDGAPATLVEFSH